MTLRRAARLAGFALTATFAFALAFPLAYALAVAEERGAEVAVPGYAGRFYPAHGRYLWTRNCNWWTVKRLAAAALAGGDAGVVFAGQVSGRLHGFQARRADAPAT